LSRVRDSRHSRFPVYRGDIDNIQGFVLAKELLNLAITSPDFSITTVLRKPYFVPEAKRVHDLMREMQQDYTHIAMVVDEYGMLSGLVTTEDLLEELVGEIEDEYDSGKPKRIQRLQNGAFIVDALLSVSDLEQLLGARFNNKSARYETLSGMILYELGELPEEGKTLIINNYRFTCTKVKGTALLKVKIEPSLKS
jgi:putative hemolysin